MTQHSGVRTSAPEEEGVQGTVSDELDGRLLRVFEHVLEDAGDAAGQLGIILLSGEVEDDSKTYACYIIPVNES